MPSKFKKRSTKVNHKRPIEAKPGPTSNLGEDSPSESTILSGERSNPHTAESRRQAIESVIWDIEMDDAVLSRGSSPPPVEAHQACRASTVVLNTRDVRWNVNMESDTKLSPAGSHNDINVESSPQPQPADLYLSNLDGGCFSESS